MESHEEQSLRDRILQYLKVAGLRFTENKGALYVGPLVVFIGPKGAEVHFRNLSQRHRLTSDPQPQVTSDLSGRSSWVEVIHATKDPEEVISYIDNLLNPAGAVVMGTSMPSELVLEGSVYTRVDIALLRIRAGNAHDVFLEHGGSCKTCDVWCEVKGRRWRVGDHSASYSMDKLCKKGRILHDRFDHLFNLLGEE